MAEDKTVDWEKLALWYQARMYHILACHKSQNKGMKRMANQVKRLKLQVEILNREKAQLIRLNKAVM